MVNYRSCGRSFHISSQVLTCFCIIILVIAIIMPAWQTVDITEWRNHHEHGLWRDCWHALNPVTPQQREWICTYKFNQPTTRQELTVDTQDNEAQHLDLYWLRSVLGLMIAGVALSFIGLFFSIGAFCLTNLSIIWNVLSTMGMMCSAAGIIYYFKEGWYQDYLYIVAPAHVYQQQAGYCYWLAVAGTILLLFASFLSYAATAARYIEQKGMPEAIRDRFMTQTVTKMAGSPGRRHSPPLPPMSRQFRGQPQDVDRF